MINWIGAIAGVIKRKIYIYVNFVTYLWRKIHWMGAIIEVIKIKDEYFYN